MYMPIISQCHLVALLGHYSTLPYICCIVPVIQKQGNKSLYYCIRINCGQMDLNFSRMNMDFLKISNIVQFFKIFWYN